MMTTDENSWLAGGVAALPGTIRAKKAGQPFRITPSQLRDVGACIVFLAAKSKPLF
jgi:hypothetical protein